MKFDSSFFDDIDRELSISPNDLDLEWLRQPQVFMRYSMASSHFKKVAMQKAEKLKLISAELRADAAEDPEACLGRGVKPTNDNIESYVTQHGQYRNALADRIQADYEADMASSAVFAFQQRKSALENLVKLQSMEYFSAPTAGRSLDRDSEKDRLKNASGAIVQRAKEARNNEDTGDRRSGRRS